MQRYRLQRAAGGASDAIVGPLSAHQLRSLHEQGQIAAHDRIALQPGTVWAPAEAWSILAPCHPAEQTPKPSRLQPERPDLPPALRAADAEELAQLRWWLRSGEVVQGPLDFQGVREQIARADGTAAVDTVQVALVGGDAWFPATELDPSLAAARSDAGFRAQAASASPTGSCACCLETIPLDAKVCPECGEATAPASLDPASIAATEADASTSWLAMHWRPLLTLTVMTALIATGIALRHLAPERYQPPGRLSPAAAIAPSCESPCWSGEACQMGSCVWQPSNDSGHLSESPRIAGPFELDSDMLDVLPLDAERFAVSYIRAVEIRSTRTGEVIGLVSDAMHAEQLARVGDMIYAASRQRIYVIDAASARTLKTIDLGARVGEMHVGASGRRVLASLPGVRAVAVIATDYHAEVSRFFFGDDAVQAVALDDSGERALTTNGRVPVPGLPAPESATRLGASYPFDPSRLPSEQDRVRSALVGNPVDIAIIPDSRTSFVVLREQDKLVELEHLESGAVRQGDRITTCQQPEQLELIRRGRRALVACNAGRAVEVFDLDSHELMRRIPLGTRAADVAITPDGQQALIVMPKGNKGALGVLDLDSYELSVHELDRDPHRIRLTPDGKTAVVISDRSKLAWVVR